MEFWRNLKPVEKVFQPDALPEVYMANAATEVRRELLDAVGVADVEELFVQIPAGDRITRPVELVVD